MNLVCLARMPAFFFSSQLPKALAFPFHLGAISGMWNKEKELKSYEPWGLEWNKMHFKLRSLDHGFSSRTLNLSHQMNDLVRLNEIMPVKHLLWCVGNRK